MAYWRAQAQPQKEVGRVAAVAVMEMGGGIIQT